MMCGYCQEFIEKHQLAPGTGTPMHKECQIRLIVGSVAHIERRCGCYVTGSTESDPPHLTLRQAARASVTLFKARRAIEDLKAQGALEES